MDKLDSLKSTVTGDDAQWVATTFNHAMEEFNLIRASNPNIILSAGELQVPDTPSRSEDNTAEFSQGFQQSGSMQSPVYPTLPDDSGVASETNDPRSASNESFTNKVEKFAQVVSKKIEEIDNRFHISEDISDSVKAGVKNVKQFFSEKPLKEHVADTYMETKEWMQENCTKEKIVDGIMKVPYVVIDGTIKFTILISSNLMKLLNLMRREKPADQTEVQGTTEAPSIVSASLSPSDTPIENRQEQTEEAVPGMPGMAGVPGVPVVPMVPMVPMVPAAPESPTMPMAQPAQPAQPIQPIQPIQPTPEVPTNPDAPKQM